MIKVTGADGIKYIINGERYWPEEALKEALGCKDDDIFGEIKKLREERDELREKCNKLKARTNALYGTSCGYSASKQPAFRCNVISYSWEFSPIVAQSLMDEPSYRLNNDSIHVELDLTPNANYKGTFDMEDLKRYIEEYGRENAKNTREEFLRKLACSLGFGGPVVKPDNIDQWEKDILERIEKLKDGVWPCENTVTFAEHLKKEFPKFCKQYNVAPLTNGGSIHDWLQYIFEVLIGYRYAADNRSKKVEELRKEKRAVEYSLDVLRAKIREIYISVVNSKWDWRLSYISALNDINEEHKRVFHNFEERTADWSKAQQEFDRYKLAVGSLLDISKETSGDINAIERVFTFSKKNYALLKEFRDSVCEILDIPSSMAVKQNLKEIHDVVDRYDELEDFRADICGALDIEGMLGTPQQNDKYILERLEKMRDDDTSLDRYARLRSNICTALCLGGETSDEDILERVRKTRDCHEKLCKDYTELHDDYIASQKQLKDFTNRCDSFENLQRDLWEFRKNAIEDLKSRGFFFRPEENETLPEIYDKLLKRYDDYFSRYKEQYGLRQQWHARYESEHERANGEHKRAEKLKYEVECWTKRCDSLQTALNNSQNDGVALQAFRNECKKLRDEKTKVISALGQDIWDDCLK